MTEERPPHCVPELKRPAPHVLHHYAGCSRDMQIAFMQAWCLDNYEAGASTMVECWGDQEYEALFEPHTYNEVLPTFAEAFDTLFRVASVYGERESDANYYRRGEQ